MGKNGTCPYADRQASARSLHCSVLREQKAKWDYCIKQYLCRADGKYKVASDAGACALRKAKDGE